jgi:hypothetical protein
MRKAIMQFDHNIDEEIATARDHMRKAIMVAFCGIMRTTQFRPMTALSFAAMAVGSIYREIADAHCDDQRCPCGWEPCRAVDIEALLTALAMTAQLRPEIDLRLVQAAGKA